MDLFPRSYNVLYDDNCRWCHWRPEPAEEEPPEEEPE